MQQADGQKDKAKCCPHIQQNHAVMTVYRQHQQKLKCTRTNTMQKLQNWFVWLNQKVCTAKCTVEPVDNNNLLLTMADE